jgi:cytochrome c oxidase assembly protein subunit 15
MTAPAAPAASYRLAVALVIVTIVVIGKGAMVTSTASGLAFSDWPLSDGALMPERSLTTLAGFLEHFHRVAGALAGILSVWLTVVVLRQDGARSPLGRLVLVGLLLIVVQGVIGGVGVRLGLPVVTSVAHATLAQVTIATFAVIAYRLSPRWAETVPAPHPSARRGRKLLWIGVAVLVLQTVLGAIARHSGSEHALWTHVGNAFVVFLLVIVVASYAAGRFPNVRGVAGLARGLLGLLVVQVVLGFIALLVRTGKHPENIEHLWRASLISAHVLTGALLTLVGSLLAAHVGRGTTVPPGETARA